ncbi:MAG: peptidylprolyl isomerase [Ignavibacteriaceae bacterium]|nr:peptidylprolyl isomerase [Ignavibacteriaceae bacterium]
MYIRLVVYFSIISAFLFTSCSPKHSDILLAEFGDTKVKMGEFEEAYLKNAGGQTQAKSDSLNKLKNFLDLYVNFKMKLRDAEVRGYENDQDLMNELLDYKKKIGVTFILEKSIVEPGIQEMYDRRKWELRVSHIMIRPDSTGDEAARLKAVALMDSLKNGVNYEELAKRNSQDFYSAPYGGDIFYITAGMLPAEFEDACYKTPVGSIYPQVLKTRFGQHIIKVTEKRARVPKIKASHILINFNNANGEMDSLAAKATADSVKMLLNSGADFSELAAKYSEDPGSKDKGGDLGFFERRMMVREFDEAAFNLKVGEISNVVKSNFGFHIIKLTEKAPLPSLDDEKENLKKIFKQTKYQEQYDKLIDSLKIKYRYKLNEKNYSNFLALNDSVRISGDSPGIASIKDSTLYTIANKKTSVSELWSKMISSAEFTNRTVTSDVLTNAIKKFSSDDLLELEALNLEKSNASFAALMEDYKNGIFIFKLQEEEIWNKISVDSVKLYDFYKQNLTKYNWPDRVSFSEIFTRRDSLAKNYLAQLNAGANFDTLASKYTERPGFKEKAGKFDLVDSKSTQLAIEADKLKHVGEFSSLINNAGGYSIVRLNSKEAARTKTFEEAKAEVSGAFQEAESKKLEHEYLDKLRARYNPVIHYENLEKAFKE